MTVEEAIEIAREHAQVARPSNYTEPFQPEEWVIDAMLEAAHRGWNRGWDGATKSYRRL